MASKNALPLPIRAEPVNGEWHILAGPRQTHVVTVFGSRRYPAKRLAEFIVECLTNHSRS